MTRLPAMLIGVAACGEVAEVPDAPAVFDARALDAAPSGSRLGVLPFGGALTDFGECVTSGPDGDVYVAGSFESTGVAFGAEVINSAGNFDTLLARLGPNREVRWVRWFGGTEQDRIHEVATDPATGDLAIAGYFYSASLVLGPGATLVNRSGDGGRDGFVARFTADGTLRWAQNVGGTGLYDRAIAVRFTRTGDVVFAGAVGGSCPYPSGTILADAANDLVLARLDGATGAVAWAYVAGGTSGEEAWGLELDEDAAVPTAYLVGLTFSDSFAYGGPTPLPGFGGLDAVVLAVSLGGDAQWARRMGGPVEDASRALARRPNGNLLIPLYFGETADLGPGLGQATAAGITDGRLVELTAIGGAVGSVALAGPQDDQVRGVWVADDGAVWVGGYYGPGATLGGTPLPGSPTGPYDAWLARLNGQLDVTWAIAMGASDRGSIADVAFDDAAGTLQVIGDFSGDLPTPAGPITSLGLRDGVLLTLAR